MISVLCRRVRTLSFQQTTKYGGMNFTLLYIISICGCFAAAAAAAAAVASIGVMTITHALLL